MLFSVEHIVPNATTQYLNKVFVILTIKIQNASEAFDILGTSWIQRDTEWLPDLAQHFLIELLEWLVERIQLLYPHPIRWQLVRLKIGISQDDDQS